MVVTKRYYFGLDELRAGLMLIGVFWHAVSIIAPHGSFVYNSPQHESAFIYSLIYPEHIFRMEAFFLVSGFLSAMVLSRKDKSTFLDARIKRVLIPLLLGCFGVNLLLQIAGTGLQLKDFSWRTFDLWRMVMHGWFLITLFMCALIDLALPSGAAQRAGRKTVISVLLIGTVGYVLLNFWKYNILSFLPFTEKNFTGIFTLGFFISLKDNLYNFLVLNTLQFWPFYFFGTMLYAHQDFLNRLSWRNIGGILVVGVICGLAEYLHSHQIVRIFHGPYQLGALWYRINHILAAGGIAFALFMVFFRSPRKGNKVVQYLIHSAIVIYLVHHPVVILMGWWLDSPVLSPAAYYILLVSITLVISYATYEIIRRVKWLRFAFGLK